ncbi:MAG TPA: YceI family protein [Clostridia bacterium]|nr:YceI family protein [Clostridia bacterium]
MRKQLLVLSILVLASLCAFAAEEYKIDPAHSSASFTVRHLMISNVSGRFRTMSGTILYDEADPSKSSVIAVISTASITTDNDRRDKHLQSADFFDAEKYPEIRFQSTKVMKQGDGFVAVGMLTIKDVSKEVTLPFSVAKADAHGKSRLGIESGTRINRYDYNVNYDATGATVGKDVKIELNIEAVETEAVKNEASKVAVKAVAVTMKSAPESMKAGAPKTGAARTRQ